MSDGDLTESSDSEMAFFRQAAEDRRVSEKLQTIRLARDKAQRSGQLLGYFSMVWAALSVIGALIMMFQSECKSGYSYGSCDGDVTYPYVTWAIVSLFANLFLALSAYTIGSYVEARMKAALNE